MYYLKIPLSNISNDQELAAATKQIRDEVENYRIPSQFVQSYDLKDAKLTQE